MKQLIWSLATSSSARNTGRWNRSSSYSAMSRFRPRSGTSAVDRGFGPRSTTRSGSSPRIERVGPAQGPSGRQFDHNAPAGAFAAQLYGWSAICFRGARPDEREWTWIAAYSPLVPARLSPFPVFNALAGRSHRGWKRTPRRRRLPEATRARAARSSYRWCACAAPDRPAKRFSWRSPRLPRRRCW